MGLTSLRCISSFEGAALERSRVRAQILCGPVLGARGKVQALRTPCRIANTDLQREDSISVYIFCTLLAKLVNASSCLESWEMACLARIYSCIHCRSGMPLNCGSAAQQPFFEHQHFGKTLSAGPVQVVVDIPHHRRVQLSCRGTALLEVRDLLGHFVSAFLLITKSTAFSTYVI